VTDPKPDQPFFSTWHGWFIAILVASQLLIPLRYYIARRDPHDERFAWRMFSPMRMAQCTPEFTVDDKPFALGTQFHEAWVETAKRGRFRVVEEMASYVCERHRGSSVVVRLKCKYIDHEPVEYGGFDMCNVPLL
jgi:hypothetical protein